MRGGWCSNKFVGPERMSVSFIYFFFISRFVRYEVRYGSKIRYWHDCGCGDHPFKATFWNCLVLLVVKRLWWQIICSFLREIFSGMFLTKLVHDWGVDMITFFSDLLYSLRLRQGGGDTIMLDPF